MENATQKTGYQILVDKELPIYVISKIVSNIQKAYSDAFKETIGDPMLPSGVAFEHLPQERRTRVQRALISSALSYSSHLTFDENHTRPRGGRFVKLRAGNLIIVEKFLSSSSAELPMIKYVRLMVEQPGLFEKTQEDESDPIFAIIVHGYDEDKLFLDSPGFIDLVFPNPINPLKVSDALCRIDLIGLVRDYQVNLTEAVEIPLPPISLKATPDELKNTEDSLEEREDLS